MNDLGPATEARFAEAFSSTALLTAKAAAVLIGVDEKTLANLTDRQVIRSVPRGKLRAYTERDLRAYLLDPPEAECRSTSPRKAASTSTTSFKKVAAFTAQQARKLDAPRRRSSGSSGSTRLKVV